MMRFEIQVAPGALGTKLLLDGNVVPGMYSVQLRHEAGYLPVLEVETHPQEITTAGDACPVWLIGGELFTQDDATALLEAAKDEPTLAGLAERFARALAVE